METISVKKVRVFRGKETILSILSEYKKSNLSIKAFCEANNIASASFHNWKKKYSNSRSSRGVRPGFATLQITPSGPVTETSLFAEVNSIKIYQPVSAAYLKELLV
jgi:transposase-like protein